MMMVVMVGNVRPQFHDFSNLGEGPAIVKGYRPDHGCQDVKKKGCATLAGQPFNFIRYRESIA
jgi:hypothetical protein